MKTLVFLLFIFASEGYMIAQQNVSSDQEIISGFDGTFQIEIQNVRYMPNIPGNIIEIVNQNRLDNQTNYYPLDENIKILIPSRLAINNSNWIPLKLISYVD